MRDPTLLSLPLLRRGSALFAAIARGDALLRSVLRRGFLDHGPHDRLVGGDPVGDRVPLRAVPLQELHRPASLVVHAGHFQRLHKAGRAELLELLVVDAEVFEAPADLVAGHRLALAVSFLRRADRLGGDDAENDAAVVVDAADAALVFHLALALGVDELLDLLDHRVVAAGNIERGGDIALGRVARRDHVLFGAAPPYAHDLGAREADLGGGLERGRVHHAPTAQDHPVGLDLPDLQPLRLLLVPRVRDRNVAHFEAVSLRLRIEHGNRFLAVGRVVIDVHDLLAPQLVHAAFLHADELDLGGVLAPVVGDEGEHPRKHAPVGGVGAAVADRHDGNVVGRPFVYERIGDAGGKRVHERRAGRAPLLGALVAFDAARIVVLGLALLVGELHAVDSAVARDRKSVV